MPVILTASDLSRLSATQQVVLSALNAPSTNAWMLGVHRTLRDLVGGDRSLSIGRIDGPVRVVDGDLPSDQRRFIRDLDWVAQDESPHALARMGLKVMTTEHMLRHLPDGGRSYTDSWAFNELHRPMRNVDIAALTEDFGAYTENFITGIYSESRGTFGDHALALLTLVHPAYQAGVAARRRLAAHAGHLAAVLDQIGVAAAVVDREGRVLHRNTALDTMPLGPEARAALEQEIKRLRGAIPAVLNGQAVPGHRVSREVAADGWRLRVTLAEYPDAAQAGRWWCISVEPLARPQPGAMEIARRFGLTVREAQVAALLGRGLPNSAIATALGISTHTTRRHTERVLAKLGLVRRAEVASRLAAAQSA